MMENVDKNFIKQQLLSVTEDLARYKDIDAKNINFDKNEIKSKIIDVLNRISVTVSKLNPPINADVEAVSVTMEEER